jgi:hypothetical protein
MRRREFTAWPVAASAQQPALPVIGYLSGATFEAMHDWLTAFKQSLAESGFTEGRRREFVALAGGAAVMWPLATRAQQPDRVRRIGVLMAFDDPGFPVS